MVVSTPLNFAVNSARSTNSSCGGPCANTNGSEAVWWRAGIGCVQSNAAIPAVRSLEPWT